MYQERDLAVVAVAALGAGFLVGAELHPSPPVVAAAGAGTTIVRRLELPPQPRQVERWEGDVLRVTLTPAPLMAQPSPWEDPQPTQQEPAPEVTRQERAMLQQPEKPRDGCYPGHRETFYYKRVLHWRCSYK